MAARIIGLLVGIALLGLWLLRADAPRATPPTGGTAVIAFGDSLVAGRGASPGQDFVSVLSRRTGIPIVNAGRSGDTTGSALERLEEDVLARDPRIVIVLLGGNDFLRRIPAVEAFGNLGTIVERIRGAGAAVILVGVAVGLLEDPYAERYEALARDTGSGLVPDILDGILGRQDLMADPIHPNDSGYAIIAGRLDPVLRELASQD